MASELFRKRPDPADKPATTVEDIVNKNALARLRKDPPGQAAKGKDKIDDSDLIASMAKRLSLLEKDLKAKARELERAQGENEALRSKLHVAEEEIAARGSSAAGPSAVSDDSAHLRSENARLRAQTAQAWKQVADMKVFLNDYGMVWVGPDERRRSSSGGQASASGIAQEQPVQGGAGPSHGVVSSGVGFRPGSGAGPLPPRPPAADKQDGQAAAPLRPDIRRRSYTGSESHTGGARSPQGGGPSPSSADGPPMRPSSHPHNSSSPSDSHPEAPAQGGLPFRMADLLSKVDELNQMAGDGCGQLVAARGGGAGGGGAQAHVLHTPDPVRLTVFKDGIQLHRGAPRPFRDAGTAAVLADILDGYFPAPLKADFPDGVPIKVVDRSRDSYKDALSPVNHPALRNGGGGNVRSWNDLEAGEGQPMSRDNFLSRLPQAVIKNGKVIDVRGGVGRLMSGADQCGSAPPASNVSVVPTAADALLTTSQRNHRGPVLPPPSREAGSARPAAPQDPAASDAAGAPAGKAAGGGPAPLHVPVQAGEASSGGAGGAAAAAGPAITTLQIKSEDGQQTLIVKMQYDDTIGALRKYINAHRAQQKDGNRSTAYEIRTAFPPRKYDTLTETLRDAGLVPNATLFLRTAAQ